MGCITWDVPSTLREQGLPLHVYKYDFLRHLKSNDLALPGLCAISIAKNSQKITEIPSAMSHVAISQSAFLERQLLDLGDVTPL